MLVFSGDAQVLSNAHRRAPDRGVRCSVFTSELFSTGHDDTNRAAVQAVPLEKLDLVGIAMHGPKPPPHHGPGST